jgi:Putative 2OG-Fe(II) oxygenase
MSLTLNTLNTLNIFDHTVIVGHCDHVYYFNNTDLNSSVTSIFNLSEIKNRVRGADWDSHVGEGLTSEIIPYLGPANVPGSKDLTAWITQRVRDALQVDKVTILKSWMNRMDFGSQGRCHNHISLDGSEPTPDLVGIFYVNNPKNGSNLVLIKDGIPGALHSEFEEFNKFYITPKTGDLILHRPGIWHAVTEQNSNESRICFVYHFSVDNK